MEDNEEAIADLKVVLTSKFNRKFSSL